MPKRLGDLPLFPDLRVQIRLSSRQEDQKILTEKLRSLRETAFGESETVVTEIRIRIRTLGDKKKETIIEQDIEVYYPKE